MSIEPIPPSARPRHALICNPTARSGRGRRAWDRIVAQVDAAAASYSVRVSEYPGHAVALAEEEARRGTDVLVAVGGDGTIGEVLCGLMRVGDDAQSRPALGILYTGTSPDVCRFHRIPLDLDEAVATLLAGHRRRVDVGEIRFGAPETAAHFLCSVNLGLGAAVAQGSNGGLRKYCGDFLGTLLSILGAVATFRPADFTCVVDGDPLELRRVFNITIGKNPHIASGLRVASSIQPDDGTMYLFAIKDISLALLLRSLPRLYDGTFHTHPKALFRLIRSFECPYNPAAPRVEFDGDPRGMLPCTVTLRPRALELIVPAPGGEAP